MVSVTGGTTLARETPLNAIHLKNMHTLTLAGATIMPPCPGFYTNPQTIEELVDATVARVLDQLGLEHDLIRRWGEKGIGSKLNGKS